MQLRELDKKELDKDESCAILPIQQLSFFELENPYISEVTLNFYKFYRQGRKS